MSLAEEYQIALKEQKKLIVNLSGSGPSIPGLNVESVAARLAELDTNLQDSLEYYTELAAQSDERLKSLDADDIETRESIEKERKQALDDAKKISEEYVESQRDFIQEQIAIIEVNAGVIQGAVASLPAAITAATLAASLPTAVGAAVPNYLYNIGVLLPTLQGFAQTLKLIKTAFLNMLIAADKIKFVLPPAITGFLNKIIKAEKKSEKETKLKDIIPPGFEASATSKEWVKPRDQAGGGYFQLDGSGFDQIFKEGDKISITSGDNVEGTVHIVRLVDGNKLYINEDYSNESLKFDFIIKKLD